MKILEAFGLYDKTAVNAARFDGRAEARKEYDAEVSNARVDASLWKSRAEAAESKVREQLASDAAIVALRVLKTILDNKPASDISACQAQMIAAQQNLAAYRPAGLSAGQNEAMASVFGNLLYGGMGR